MINWKEKDTVIFDMDGTVLDTIADLAGSVNHVLGELGYPLKTLDEVKKSVGNGAGRLMERVLPGGREDPRYDEALQMHVAYYEAHCRIRTGPYPGIVPMLRGLQQAGIKMAIVSNKGDGAVKRLKDEFFKGLVGTAVGERDGIRIKPAPDAVWEAIRQLGSIPEKSIYVGDSEVDCETAVNAGIPGVMVAWGFRGRALLEQQQPDLIIDEPQELVQLLGCYTRERNELPFL